MLSPFTICHLVQTSAAFTKNAAQYLAMKFFVTAMSFQCFYALERM